MTRAQTTLRTILAAAPMLFLACTSDNDNPVTPSAGMLEVSIETLGTDLDADGFNVTAGSQSAVIAANGKKVFELDPGMISVRVDGLASNCFLTTSATDAKEVVRSFTTRVNFVVDCFPRTSRVICASTARPASLVILNPFERTKTVVTSGLDYYHHPTWSPNGEQIVFDANVDIYRINADGTGLLRLTASGVIDEMPTFSPDGTQIAYIKFSFNGTNIWMMNADGANQRQITQTSGRSEGSPQFRPKTGERLIFSVASTSSASLETMRPDGSERAPFVTELVVNPLEPEWSPDGSKLVVIGSLSGTTARTVFLLNADGTGTKQLTMAGENDNYPHWSPNGRWILFTRRANGQDDLYMAPVVGNALVRLTADGATNGSWKP